MALVKQVENVLPEVILENQTGYVKTRYIGENVRLIKDVMDFSQSQKSKRLPVIAVFVDFKKAFDSIKWD